MSETTFAEQYQRVKNNIEAAYDKIEEKGGTIPATLNSANLANAIDTISGSGSEGIVTFADGTDEQIAAMLNAHYAGQIDIADYWSVGDTRKIHLNSIASPNTNEYTTAWSAQDITIVITAIKHHDLATPINGVTKAAITCQTRECVNNLSKGYNENGCIFVNLNNDYDTTFKKWSELPMRTWMNGAFLKATTYNGTTTETVTDSIFLPSEWEIFGSKSYAPVQEGTQWDYYKTTSNRIKYGNNAGKSNGTACFWWEGSPSTTYGSGFGYCWCFVLTAGRASGDSGNVARGFAPAFAL